MVERLKYLIIGFVGGCLVGLLFGPRLLGKIAEPKPGYVPSAGRLQTLEALNEAEGTYLPNFGKVYQVGQTYREGDAAYFSGSKDNYAMQLEEWRQDANKNFGVTIWRFEQNNAERWSFAVTPEGMLSGPLGLTMKLDIRDADVIAHSIRAQGLLLGNEFDNPRHLREVVQKDDCARIAEVHAYEDGNSFVGPWYLNRVVLADGRRVEERSVFIRQRGELFCHFWTELVVR